MKWLNFKRTDGGEVLLREDDIDYIVINNENHKAKIYQKNGKDQIVNSIGIADRLLLTEEKTKLNSLYGVMASRPLPDFDPEVLQSEIQDLKLENDRLKRRNELMEDYIHALACIKSKKSKFHELCDNGSCPYYDQDRGVFEGACKLGSRDLIEKEAADLIDKLEEL